MKQITATYKGLITGVAMIAASLLIYLAKGNFDGNIQYIVYCLYTAGIVWTLLDFKKQATGFPGFKAYFSQGFKCFIVVTLLMVLFTLVFILLHPELRDTMLANMQVEMAKNKDLMPSDIQTRLDTAKKVFLPGYLMGVIFGYLLIGSVVTLIGAAFLSAKKDNA